MPSINRPHPILALYYLNPISTTLEIKIVPNATVIAIRYTGNTTVTHSISFVGKSSSQVEQEINALAIPIRAIAVTNIPYLSQGDILPLGADFISLPGQFNVYDRLPDNGILLRSKNFIVRHKDRSNLRLESPYYEDSSLPWYPRISNGSFTKQHNNKVYHFYLPEFDNQSWSVLYGKPFKDLKGISPTLIDRNVYQLPRYPVYFDNQNITLYNKDIPVSSLLIDDIDVNNGILYLAETSIDPDNLTIDYTYLETSYVYKDININGHFSQNPSVLHKYVLIYLLPAEGEQLNKKTVYHIVSDSIEQAIGSIKLTSSSEPVAVLGAYCINPVRSDDRVQLLDTRSKGGGLIDVNGPSSPTYPLHNIIIPTTTPIENRYVESSRFWDIGNADGIPYPGAAAVVMDLPDYAKEKLDVSDIRIKATKFLAAGVYPVLNFSSRELPAITGHSVQVSCAVNIDLSETYIKQNKDVGTTRADNALLNTIPDSYTGIGLLAEPTVLPTSISDSWSGYQPISFITTDDDTPILEIGVDTGVYFNYLKSSQIAGASWKERTLASVDPLTNYRTYSAWTTKTVLDTREVATGELVKSRLTFNPGSAYKQYKDIQLHAPFHTETGLKLLLEDKLSSIIDKTLDLKSADKHALSYTYPIADDSSTKQKIADYTLIADEYNTLLSLRATDLEVEYASDIENISNEVLAQCIPSGHYFNFFSTTTESYLGVSQPTPYIIVDYTNSLKMFSYLLDYRDRFNLWDSVTTTGLATATGLVSVLFGTSDIYGSFLPAIPKYWYYFPKNADLGVVEDTFSGSMIPSASDLGGSLSEVNTNYNYDYLYNNSLPAFVSTVIAHTGDIADAVSDIYTGSYGLTVTQTINNIKTAINNTRTLSGLPCTTHWFIGHNRLGQYLGNATKDIIDTYDYIYSYLTKSSPNTLPSGEMVDLSVYMYSGIEKMLYTAYDAVYNNLLRNGIVEPDLALTISAYGWYINHWEDNNLLSNDTYENDYRELFEPLFTNGLKTLLTNNITEDGEVVETTYINGAIGPFPAVSSYKILYPLAQAIKYDTDAWEPIATAVITTICNRYEATGLYYQDPYKVSNAQNNYNIGKALAEMYRINYGSGDSHSWGS